MRRRCRRVLLIPRMMRLCGVQSCRPLKSHCFASLSNCVNQSSKRLPCYWLLVPNTNSLCTILVAALQCFLKCLAISFNAEFIASAFKTEWFVDSPHFFFYHHEKSYTLHIGVLCLYVQWLLKSVNSPHEFFHSTFESPKKWSALDKGSKLARTLPCMGSSTLELPYIGLLADGAPIASVLTVHYFSFVDLFLHSQVESTCPVRRLF